MAARSYKKPRSFTLDIPPDVVRDLLEQQAPIPPARSHTSVYLSRAVLRELRRISADLDCKPHDMLIQGVELVLRKYGKPSIAEIEHKEITGALLLAARV